MKLGSGDLTPKCLQGQSSIVALTKSFSKWLVVLGTPSSLVVISEELLHVPYILQGGGCVGTKSEEFCQRGRKLILDGGTQLNNNNLIFAKISPFSTFYSIKSPKDGGT